jgi:uncharacterized phage-associated protein
MFDARKVANLILREFDANRFDVTNLKLNKVLYYVHAFHLARMAQPLIKNHIEAWEHGPVVRVVYQEFKEFGAAPILRPATYLNYETGNHEIIGFEDIQDETRSFVLEVARYYMQFTGSQLREMTHERGGPWDVVFNSNSENRGIRDRIPNELIVTHTVKSFGRISSLN